VQARAHQTGRDRARRRKDPRATGAGAFRPVGDLGRRTRGRTVLLHPRLGRQKRFAECEQGNSPAIQAGTRRKEPLWHYRYSIPRRR
jgi:hypothetical protein